MKILVIEDEILLADSIKALLQAKGFEVECVYDGEDGAAYAETGIYDLLILDVMMPKMNGYDLARKVRANRCATPILMLTAKAALDDEIEGLNAGADYYLTKPFESRKLLACISALLRRQGQQVNEMVLGNTSLDILNATLCCGENHIRLSSKEFDVMRFLMSSHDQILPKELILCRVWGFDSNAVENHVEVYVSLLRKKLSHIGSNVNIEAVRRLGYVMKVVGT
ncbi:MAG: response regulator transcription factor [Oscillospiraceae bacterium]|nr:response regulator transcription factor [Oscillospiraceae bacterium]